MSHDEAFLSDIIEHPEDDTPRLVYADWLEEQDDERGHALAAFIRVQMELERAEEGPALWELRRREEALLRQWRPAWIGRLGDLVLGESFRRGFVAGITLQVGQLLDRADEIFRLAPVQDVCLGSTFRLPTAEATSSNDSLLVRLAASPHLGRLTSLRLHLPLGARGARALADSPHLGRLRELELECSILRPAALDALLHSPLAGRLRVLSLRGALSSEAIRALAECPGLSGLDTLRLRGRHQDGVSLLPLADSPFLPAARVLHLEHLRIEPSELTVLVGKWTARLEELSLAGNWLGDAGLRGLLRALRWPGLRRLDLSYNLLHAAGVAELGASAGLQELTWLNLRGNIAGGAGLAGLARSPHLGRLRSLLLHFNGVRDDGLLALAEADRPRPLVWLELVANRIGDVGAMALADSDVLPHLARLELARNAIAPLLQSALRERFGPAVSF